MELNTKTMIAFLYSFVVEIKNIFQILKNFQTFLKLILYLVFAMKSKLLQISKFNK